MKRFVLILTAMALVLTLCACTIVEPSPEDPVEDAVEDVIEDVIEDIEVEDPVAEEEEVIGIVNGEEVYDGESPFTINIVDPDHVSDNAIYIETAEISEEAINYVIDQLEHMSSGVITSLGYSEDIVNGMSVATGIRPYNGSTGEYYDTFYYFPIMYGDEVVSMAISSNSDGNYGFQFGSCSEATAMNYIETSAENPAMLVYFDDRNGGYFVTTTSAWKFVEDENGSYEIAEEDIPDYIREIMNREVNPDNVVAIYGATVATEELIDD
ncbi:MAG: hypothetical protein LUH56_02465 [Oscillospiraceae bacterium]|nr:hypothetical protein [Oscillospiraceae bacterium]